MAEELQTNILIRIMDAFTGPLKALGQGVQDVEGKADRLRKSFALAADLNQAAEAAGRFSNMLSAPLEGAVKEFISFERAMSQVSALTGQMVGSANFTKLKDQALALGASTAYSSEEVAQVMATYAQAGRTTQDILALLPETLAAAKANSTGLAETGGIVTRTMRQMGLGVADTSRVVNVLTAGAAASDMSLSDMGTALAIVGPKAHEAGMSLELTTAFLGKLKDEMGDASSAGTGFRGVLSKLIDPSKEAQHALKKMGFSTKEIVALQKAVADGHPEKALAAIGEAANKLPDNERLKRMSQIFGLESSTAASIAIKTSLDMSPDGVRAAEAALHKVDDAAKNMAKIMEDNLGGSIDRAQGAISGLNTRIGEVLAPTVDSASKSIEGMANSALGIVNDYPVATKATLELVATMSALALGVKGVLLAASTYTSVAATMSAGFATLAGTAAGFTAMTLGVAAAAGLAGYAVGSWIEETFSLADKISTLLGRPLGVERATKQGLDAEAPQVLAGGWTVDKTGKVLKEGTGDGPKQVREARAAGAQTKDEINAYIAAHPRAAAAAPADAATAPGAPATAPTAPGAPVKGAAAPAAGRGEVVAATRAQTTEVVGVMSRVDEKLGHLLEETRRANRGRSPTPNLGGI
jgi:TP901 family phage tail tape measure protein